MNRSLLTLMLSGALCSPAIAHDYWIEAVPSPADPSTTELRLLVGECLKIEEQRAFQPAKTVAFTGHRGDSKSDLIPLATPEATPLASLPSAQQPALIAFERNWSYIELKAKKFEDYLDDEGFKDALAERRQRKESAAPGRERYRRYLNALLPTGANDPAATATLGQKLELVPLRSPGEASRGDRIQVRLLFEGQPLAGAPVEICQRSSPTKVRTIAAETNDDGIASLPIKASGLTLIRAVQMRRVTDGDAMADWESYWTSYSFVAR